MYASGQSWRSPTPSRKVRGFESYHLCNIGKITENAVIAQLIRASDFQSEGREFESLLPHEEPSKASCESNVTCRIALSGVLL